MLANLPTGSYVGFDAVKFNYAAEYSTFCPDPGRILNSSKQIFSWEIVDADEYWLDIGSSQMSYDIFGERMGSKTSVIIDILPNDGRLLYVTLWARVNKKWQAYTYTYTAYSAPEKADMIEPLSGSKFDSNTQTFTWNDAGAEAYWISIGSTEGGEDLFSDGQGKCLSQTITGLLEDGRSLYVRLWSIKNGERLYNDYTYTTKMP